MQTIFIQCHVILLSCQKCISVLFTHQTAFVKLVGQFVWNLHFMLTDIVIVLRIERGLRRSGKFICGEFVNRICF